MGTTDGAYVEYHPRVIDAEVMRRLSATRTVVIEGVRGCGKTESARQQATSEVLLDVDHNALEVARLDPSLLLEGERPRLIDEWQLAPSIWNHVRRASDNATTPGQFILTGSAEPADDVTRHTGAGRIGRIRMRPMSLFEIGVSTEGVSLAAILDGGTVTGRASQLTLPTVAELLCRGGWPGALHLSLEDALRFVADYVDDVRRVDVRNGGSRTPASQRMVRFMRSLARNTSTPAKATTLAADTAGHDGRLDVGTVRRYHASLSSIFVVEDAPAWDPNLRSRSRLRKLPTHHFVDPSLATAVLGLHPTRLMDDLSLFGLLFESLAIRDLRVYAQPSDASVYHYHDNTGLEVDAIIEATDGRWIAVEVKLGGDEAIESGAKNLLRLRDRVDMSIIGEPSKLVVLTATGYAFEREDGVAVVPIGTLAP